MDSNVFIDNLSQKINETFSTDLIELKINDLSEERKQIYAEFLNSCSDLSIRAVIGLDRNDNSIKEYIFQYNPSSNEILLLTTSCLITYEDLSVSACVEYCFLDEEPYPVWHLAKVSIDAILDFKRTRFEYYESLFKSIDCKRALKRMLQLGPKRNIFEKFIFPTPASLSTKYKVIDERTGKTIDLPHEVGNMRIWNPASGAYDEFDARLEGAPVDEADMQEYWLTFLDRLREFRGADEIDELLQ